MNCARWDLCGGRSVMGVPTAILGRQATSTTLAEVRAHGLAVVGSMSDGLASFSKIAYAASTRAGIG